MTTASWQLTLAVALGINAAVGFGYRVFRLSRGGPLADVIGQAVLGVILAALAVGTALGAGWPRWAALIYALLFGVAVMPLWVLAVLIPLDPKRIDYVFTTVYWLMLLVIAIASIAL
jgi:heme/copper-type cytochrome/quinol oxidase subunit 4